MTTLSHIRRWPLQLRALLMLCCTASMVLQAVPPPPEWWTTRQVLNPATDADDYAAVNQGQLKNIASAAIAEMNANLPDGAGEALNALESGWENPTVATDDYAVVTQGQLKKLVTPIFQRLPAVPPNTGYPWPASAQTDDYALANLGQVKALFNFSIPVSQSDSDHDGMSNDFELANGLNKDDPLDAYDDPDGDFLFNVEEAQYAMNPQQACSSGTDAILLYTTPDAFTRYAGNDYEGAFVRVVPSGLVRDNGPVAAREYEDDWDADGLSNRAEVIAHQTDPRNGDSDADGQADGAEVSSEHNPNDPGSCGLPVQIAVVSGNHQSTLAGIPFSEALTVKASIGTRSVAGQNVTFTLVSTTGGVLLANTGMMGSVVTAQTDASGLASVVFQATGAAGPKSVVATLPSDATSALPFTLIVASPPQPQTPTTPTTPTGPGTGSPPEEPLIAKWEYRTKRAGAGGESPFYDPFYESGAWVEYANRYNDSSGYAEVGFYGANYSEPYFGPLPYSYQDSCPGVRYILDHPAEYMLPGAWTDFSPSGVASLLASRAYAQPAEGGWMELGVAQQLPTATFNGGQTTPEGGPLAEGSWVQVQLKTNRALKTGESPPSGTLLKIHEKWDASTNKWILDDSLTNQIEAIQLTVEAASGSSSPTPPKSPPASAEPTAVVDEKKRERLLPVDITVRKKGETLPPDGLVLKTGDTAEFRLCDEDSASFPIPANKIIWFQRKLKADGSLDAWNQIGIGVRYEKTNVQAGIFEVKAKIISGGATTEIIFDRNQDAPHGANSDGVFNEHLRARKPDYYGVSSNDGQIKLRNSAKVWLGSAVYAKTKHVDIAPGWPNNPDTTDAPKCNIFVFHRCNEPANIATWVPGFQRLDILPFPRYVTAAPMAREDWWSQPEENVDLDAHSWSQQGASQTPEPGQVSSSSGAGPNGTGHMGIMDYDGTWINAGSAHVNKSVHLTSPSSYQPTHTRSNP